MPPKIYYFGLIFQGFYSPASSLASKATIRSTNAKETKEKKNRQKLLQGPGSDFSLMANDNDFEMDYYDYNVVNAGAAPGSYLGMDPAFLVWIPPLDEDGEILPTDEDLRPKVYIDPGSNQESPDEKEVLLPKLSASEKLVLSENKTVVSIQLHEFPKNKRCSSKLVEEMEKETKVEKSPSYEEIKYADEEEEEEDEDNDDEKDQCNIEAYQDSNILSSS